MKRIAFFLLIAVPFFSCNWSDAELPKSIGIKTGAKYEFSLGTFSGNLSEYLSVQTLTESLGNSDADFDFKIYDYYPAYKNSEARQMQQFLIDFPIKTVTLDINDHLKEMDFSTALEKMSFAPDIIDLKNFNIKDIDPITVKPDINKKIEESANLIKCAVTIPKTGGENGFPKEVLDSMTATIKILSPIFDEMQFYEARIDFTATPENTDDEQGFSTNLTLGLFNEGENEPISKIEKVNLPDRAFSFPLNGKTIKRTLYIKVISGTANNFSNDGSPITYNLESKLNNVKIQRVTNLTIDDPISVPIGGDTGTNITIDIGKSPKCEIGEGSIDIIAEQNETWKEWTGVKIEPKIKLEGAITASPEDFKKDVEKEGEGKDYFIYRTMSLNGVTYHNNDKIIVKGSVDVNIQNANIQFAENEDDTIIVKPTCNIKEIAKLWLKLADDDVLDGYNEEEDLGSEITKYIVAFGIDNSRDDYRLFELNVDYINTLPKGNDIDLDVKSEFFQINGNEQLKAGETGKNTKITSPETFTEKEINEGDKIDFNIKWKIPGRGEDSDNPECVILKNLKMGETYELKVTVSPTVNWDYVKIKANGITEEGAVNTGLNFNGMFESFEEKLVGSDGKSIIEKIQLINMPLYFYCIMPFSGGIELQGKIAVGTGNIEDGKPIWEATPTGSSTKNPTPIVGEKEQGGEIKYERLQTTGSLPKLQFKEPLEDSDDEAEMIIAAIGESKDDPKPVDIADLFNLHSGSNIIFEYGMKLGGGAGEPITLEKLKLTSNGDSEPAKIQFHARLVIPLGIDAVDDINLSFAKLLNKKDGNDLFNRDEATSNDTIEDLINTLEYARLNAYFPKSPSVIQYFIPEGDEDTTTNVRVEIDPKIDGIDGKYTLDMGNKEPVEISGDDFSKILGECPFTPDIQFVIPKGSFYIRHNFEYELKMELGTKFNNEEILIFGDKK